MSIARILVVDDDPDFCEITRLVLEPAGYEIVTASGTAEAMKQIDATWPDLVLLDVVMRGATDGVEFALQLHHDPVLRHLPIIMITSIADTRHAGEATPDDVPFLAAWLAKPVSPKQLIATVRQILEQRA
jgi:CheY-like chemotaxis protein